MKQKIIKLITNDYTLTLATSAVSILLSVVLSGVFARLFVQEDFLLYNVLARYFSFFQAVLSGMIGFGIIYVLKQEKNILHKIIASFSGFYIGFFALILAIVLVFFQKDGLVFNTFHWTIFVIGSFWFLGESFKHMFNFLLRGNDQFNLANIYTLSINVGVIGLCIFLTWQFSMEYYEYQFMVGILAIVASFAVTFFIKGLKWERPIFDVSLIRSILNFSVSRWIENIFRLLFIVALISYLTYIGQQDMAGYIAILFTLVKMSESSLQAFMTVIFSKSAKMNSEQLKRQFLIQTVVGVGFSAFIMGLFWIFGEPLIGLWLGKKYLFLTPHFQYLSFCVFAVIITLIYKGVFENSFKHSPLMILNFLLLASIGFLPFLTINLYNLVWFIVIVFWVRFFIYIIVIFMKFRAIVAAEKLAEGVK